MENSRPTAPVELFDVAISALPGSGVVELATAGFIWRLEPVCARALGAALVRAGELAGKPEPPAEPLGVPLATELVQ